MHLLNVVRSCEIGPRLGSRCKFSVHLACNAGAVQPHPPCATSRWMGQISLLYCMDVVWAGCCFFSHAHWLCRRLLASFEEGDDDDALLATVTNTVEQPSSPAI